MFRFVSRARSLRIVATAAITLFLLSPARASAQFSNIFFFGDSFTDAGNVTGLALLNGFPNPTPPPYAPGRFSNGPVWSDLFAARLGVPAAAGPAWLNAGSNYAVGGATTGTSGILGTPTGMLSQGALFASQHPGGVPANGLFVLWGGGNDIINAVSLPTPGAQLQAVQQAVTNLAMLAGGLFSNFGATNFLIPSLPDVGIAPLYAADPTSAAIATNLTTAFNQLLGVSIMQLDALPGVNAFGLNLNNLLTNIRIDAAQGGPRYGITNTTIPCFTLPNPATGCNSALFVDGRHPTTLASALIADAAYNRVVLNTDVAAVPEPTTVALVAVGLLFTAVASRRRRTLGG